MNYIETFTNALKNKKTELQINGDEFLLCSQLDAVLTYKLSYLNDVVSISAKFESEFDEIQAVDILKRRCILNKTFDDVFLNMVADCEIGVNSLEHVTFGIYTKNNVDFCISDDCSEAVRYMLFVMQIVAIADNISNA